MFGLRIKAPFVHVFNNTGAAGPRRLFIIGGTISLFAAGVAVVTLSRHTSVPATTIAKAPSVDPLPGGPNTTPAYTDLAIRADREKADRAAAVGESSVAVMPGMAHAVAIPPPAPKPAPQPQVVAVPTPRAVAPETGILAAGPPARRPELGQPVAAQPVSLPQQQPDDAQAKAYQAAIAALLAGWGSKRQLTEVVLDPNETQHAAGAAGDRAQGGGAAVQEGGAAAQPGAPAPIDPRSGRPGGGGQVVMPAGRGIYARTVLAASSDQGGPVVVEALSGPNQVLGDRMTGTFERRNDRLVVHLDSITLPDGTAQKIDALVIAPDSMETSVASSVDQHYLSRYILPVAAAFVSGLGQAISQSNSTVVASPLGGATAFQKLNLNQEVGVAAGSAASQFGQAVAENAPHGPTVKLDANVTVGVLFLTPLTIGGDR